MKNKIFFLVLASLVLSLGFFSNPSLAANVPDKIKSCPAGSLENGCASDVIIPGQNLVLEYSTPQADLAGIKLMSLGGDTINLPLTTQVSNGPTKYYYIGSLQDLADELNKSKDWNVYINGNNGPVPVGAGLPVKKIPNTEPLPGTDSGTGAAGAGGTAASPGGITPGGGSVRTGLDQIKKEFQTTGDIAGATSIGSLIVGVIRFLMGILMVVAILMIIIGGFMYVTSAGSEERAKSGRKTVMYALMGVAVVILAYVLVNIVDKSISTGSPF
jgi:hypothetical protein